jgi:hypothetical protein
MKTNAVWMMLVFVLALVAIPAMGQSVEEEIFGKISSVDQRVGAVEASQAKARREALALQRKVAALGKSHNELGTRATSLENATMAVADRVKSAESLSAALDRRSADSKDQIANLKSKDKQIESILTSLTSRSSWALGLAILALFPWVIMVAIVLFAGITEAIMRRSKGIATTPDVEAAVVNERVAHPLDDPPATLVVEVSPVTTEVDPELGDTELPMPSHTTPTKEELVRVADAAMAAVHRPIQTQHAA